MYLPRPDRSSFWCRASRAWQAVAILALLAGQSWLLPWRPRVSARPDAGAPVRERL